MFFSWPLFNAEAVFSIFEMSFELLVGVFVVYRIVRSVGVSCACFTFFIFSCSSLIFCSHLSFLFFCMFQFDNFLDGIFPCLRCLLIGLT